MGMVTGRSGSMEMAAVSSLHDLLHITVFHIIGMATQGKGKNLSHGFCIHNQRGGDHNPCYPRTKMGMVTGGSGSMKNAAVRSLHDMLLATVF